ncbi:MAG: peptidoglycan DD-metalloendopeptidase family protein [Niabella sp.]
MSKKLLLIAGILVTNLAFSQLYKKPVYPQNYFRWPTSLTPDIVANLGELRTNHWHMGLDVRTNQAVNQNVYACADGYVSYVGIESLSWGRWIIITHPNGLSTLYGHLNDFRKDIEDYVKQHQYETESWVTDLTIPAGRFPVKKGDFIAYSGTTGGSQGPHVHWEVIDTKSGRRLNPSLFGVPIADNIAPTVVNIAMYDRGNSVFDQTPQVFRLAKSGSAYSVSGGVIRTNLKKLSFAIQAYDTRNGTSNQDGIYSARLFLDDREVSSFYLDSIAYPDSRYMNAQIDYKMKTGGGAYVQHLNNLPGDRSGVYYPTSSESFIELADTSAHDVRILVSDANGNTQTVAFKVQNNGQVAPVERPYDWAANRINKIIRPDFEAVLPMFALYDKMNTNYSRAGSVSLNAVSARHVLGNSLIPVHQYFEVRIKPDRIVSAENRNRIIIRQTGNKASVRKAVWSGDWLTAQFRDFGSFEVLIDNVPPTIPAPGSGEVINFNKASRISFTPTDNYGIADFRAEVDGKWLRFTNDKGRTWIYTFDEKVPPGEHTLTVTVTDIAGNVATRSWRFVRGVNAPAATDNVTAAPKKAPAEAKPKTPAKTTADKKTPVKKDAATNKAATTTKEKAAPAAKKKTAEAPAKKTTTPKKKS